MDDPAPTRRRVRYRGPKGQDLAVLALEAAGWERVQGDAFDLVWEVGQNHELAPVAERQGALRNHLRGMGALGLKSGLAKTLARARARLGARGRPGEAVRAPATFLLSEEWEALQEAAARDPQARWIQKPKALARGEGIALLPSAAAAPKDESALVQRYLARPHLIGGHKYTLRLYLLVSSIDPLVAWLYEDGFTKRTNRPFSMEGEAWGDRYRHLTNPDVLRHDPEGHLDLNGTHAMARRALVSDGQDADALFERVRALALRAVLAGTAGVREHLKGARLTGRGAFELLGLDVAVDDDLEPVLLECNTAPSLKVEVKADDPTSEDETRIKRGVAKDLLALVGAEPRFATPAPQTPEEHAARLDEQLGRRGGFTLLHPGPQALAFLHHLEAPGAADLWLAARACGLPRLRPAATALQLDEQVVLHGAEDGELRAADAKAWAQAAAGAPFGPAGAAPLAPLFDAGLVGAWGFARPPPGPGAALDGERVEVERVALSLRLPGEAAGPLAPLLERLRAGPGPVQGGLEVQIADDGFRLLDDAGRAVRVALRRELEEATLFALRRRALAVHGELRLPDALVALRPQRAVLVVCGRGVDPGALEQGLAEQGLALRRGAILRLGSAHPLEPLEVPFPHAVARGVVVVRPGPNALVPIRRAEALLAVTAAARPGSPLSLPHAEALVRWLRPQECVAGRADPKLLAPRIDRSLAGWLAPAWRP